MQRLCLLNVSVVINCNTFLGTRQIKCERKLAEPTNNTIYNTNWNHYYLNQPIKTERAEKRFDQKLVKMADYSHTSQFDDDDDKSEYFIRR